MTAITGPIRVVWAWADETGSRYNPRTNLPQAGIDAAAADAIALAVAASDVSVCSLEGFSLNYKVVAVGEETTGPQSVKVVAVLVFDCEGDGERLFYEQPGLKAELISIDPPMVDVLNDDPRILALAASIIANGFCNPNGAPAVALVAVLWRVDT